MCSGPLARRQLGRGIVSILFEHLPVMPDEVLAAVAKAPELPVIDATIGGGGHAVAILEAHSDRRLVGLDRDVAAVAASRERLARFGTRASVNHASFAELSNVAAEAKLVRGAVGAVLFDLGVSSHQLDTAERGFSYRQEGPLDMRMDTSSSVRAADVVNGWSVEELSALFFEHGETRFARRIARAIVQVRPITSTTQLAEIVERTLPPANRRRGHPARRVFQALRVVVNAELDLLGPAIDEAIDLLAPGGRIIVLAYHSGEDRIVKDRLAVAATGGCHCPVGLPCVCGARPTVRLLNRGARKSSVAEIAANPRAKSARLRVAERLEAREGVEGDGTGGGVL